MAIRNCCNLCTCYQVGQLLDIPYFDYLFFVSSFDQVYSSLLWRYFVFRLLLFCDCFCCSDCWISDCLSETYTSIISRLFIYSLNSVFCGSDSMLFGIPVFSTEISDHCCDKSLYECDCSRNLCAGDPSKCSESSDRNWDYLYSRSCAKRVICGSSVWFCCCIPVWWLDGIDTEESTDNVSPSLSLLLCEWIDCEENDRFEWNVSLWGKCCCWINGLWCLFEQKDNVVTNASRRVFPFSLPSLTPVLIFNSTRSTIWEILCSNLLAFSYRCKHTPAKSKLFY